MPLKQFRLARLALLLIIVAAVPEPGSGQGRSVRKIRTADKPAATATPGTAEACTAAVHQIARSWGTDALRRNLHPDFPNAPELVDSIRRATLRATNITLVVESVEGMNFTPSKDGRSTDCIAEVSTRLMFDDPQSGERRTGTTGRAQWRIRFESAR